MNKIYSLSILLLFINSGFAQVISRIESVQSVYVEIYKDNIKLGSATGFIIKSKSRNYLVTNYHVVTNKNPIDNSWLDPKIPISPNRIAILQNGKILGNHVVKFENLYDSKGDTVWYHNQIVNENVDVIELPLTDTSDITIYPVNYNNTTDSLVVSPTDRVFIPGFPLGIKSSSGFPIWKSGFLASEPDLDQENKPIVWIDDIPFPGMSGSPVYLITQNLIYRNGNSTQVVGTTPVFFMGVFSHGNANDVYGAMWKGTYLKPIFNSLP